MKGLRQTIRTSGQVAVNNLTVNIDFEREEGNLPSGINASTYDPLKEQNISVSLNPVTGKVNYSVNNAETGTDVSTTVTTIITKLEEIMNEVKADIEAETTKQETTEN